MNLLDEFTLLAHDERGAPIIDGTRLDNGLGGAVLMELALAERVDVADKKILVLSSEPIGDPVVDAALARIAGEPDPRKAKHWVGKLAKGTRQTVLDRLVAAGVLRVEHSKVMIVIPRTRYPGAFGPEPSARADARQRVRSAVLEDGMPAPRTAALCALISATGMAGKLLPDLDRKRVRDRLEEISEGEWAAEAVRKAIQDVQGAVATVVVMGGGDGGGDGGGGGGGDGGGGGGGS